MRRHRFDALSFVFAVLFGALALAALLEVSLRPVSAAWVGPAVLILVGLVLLAGAAGRGDREDDAAGDADGTVDDGGGAAAASPAREPGGRGSAAAGADAASDDDPAAGDDATTEATRRYRGSSPSARSRAPSSE